MALPVAVVDVLTLSVYGSRTQGSYTQTGFFSNVTLEP